jgi:hypothetical protein
VLVWGEGCDFDACRRRQQIIFLNSYLAPEKRPRDVFIPVSIQTERTGTTPNFQGVVSAFEACFPKPEHVAARRSTVQGARRARARPSVMQQDLAISLVYIAYALAVLLTFGAILTWVERKQARSCPIASARIAPTCACRSRRSS